MTQPRYAYMHLLDNSPAGWVDRAGQITYEGFRAPITLRATPGQIRNDQKRTMRQWKKLRTNGGRLGYVKVRLP